MEQKNKFVTEMDLTFDKSVEYKGLIFYPVKIENYFDFYISLSCLLLDQYNDENVNEDYSILQMPYLDYIFYYNNKNPDSYMDMLIVYLFSTCMRINFINNDENTINLFKNEKGHYILKINNVTINDKEFDDIKNIICFQNGIDISIFDLDPLVRKNLNETLRLQNKENKNELCSLEEQIISVMISTSLNQEEINNLTIRKFKKILERVDHKMHYEIYTLAKLSGFVTLKKEYPHWLSKIDKDISKNVTSLEDTIKQINTGNGSPNIGNNGIDLEI